MLAVAKAQLKMKCSLFLKWITAQPKRELRSLISRAAFNVLLKIKAKKSVNESSKNKSKLELSLLTTFQMCEAFEGQLFG